MKEKSLLKEGVYNGFLVINVFLKLNSILNFYIIYLARFTGTIVGVGDLSSQWSESKWRSLKVEMLFELQIRIPFYLLPFVYLFFNLILTDSMG